MRQMRTLALGYPDGRTVPSHRHDWDQLVYGTSGVLTVSTHAGSFVVPPRRAVWIPAGVDHEFTTSGFVALRTIYLPVGVAAAMPRRPGVVEVSPLLRELILHCVGVGVLDGSESQHEHLIALVIEQLQLSAIAPLHLPWPTDERARRVADRLTQRPADVCSLRDACEGSGASKRTIERLFRTETGLTLGHWRSRQRLLYALPLLAAGRSVTEVAFDVGYDSPSAFIAMFRKTLGETPKRYYSTAPG